MNEERNSAIILLDYIDNLESIINKVIDELEADRMEQFDDYVIYLQEKYLDILMIYLNLICNIYILRKKEII